MAFYSLYILCLTYFFNYPISLTQCTHSLSFTALISSSLPISLSLPLSFSHSFQSATWICCKFSLMPTWHQQWCVWVLVLAWSVPDLWGWKMARCTRSAPEEPSASRLSSVDSFCRLYYFKLEQLKCSGGIDCCCVCVWFQTLCLNFFLMVIWI